MKITYTQCDACEQRIPEGHAVFHARLNIDGGYRPATEESAELCHGCAERLRNAIDDVLRPARVSSENL